MAEIPTTSTTTLLRDLAHDSQHARWGEFVARYRPMMEAFMRERFPSLDADDVIQETLTALVVALPHYRYAPDEMGHFHNYLTGILRNKSLKCCEKQAREAALKESLCITETLSSQANLADAVTDEWRKAVMEIAMRQILSDNRIHEQSKQIFQRLTVDGMSPDAVAAAYGTSRNNVDKIKSRIIERLREIVQALEKAGDV